MEIKVYMHRTKKYNFEVADCFSVFIDLDKLPQDKRNDINFINTAFKNDCQRISRMRPCIQRYGTAYISFMRPQCEDENNGKDKIYFDNEEMLFVTKTRKEKK